MPFDVFKGLVSCPGECFVVNAHDFLETVFLVESLSKSAGGVANSCFEAFSFGQSVCKTTHNRRNVGNAAFPRVEFLGQVIVVDSKRVMEKPFPFYKTVHLLIGVIHHFVDDENRFELR